MNRYASWTPDSGTVELPSIHRGQPYYNLDTVALDVRTVRTTRIVRRPLLLTLWLRILASPAADHLRESARSAFGPAVIGAGLLLGIVLINYLAAGGYVTWDGFRSIPAGGETR